MHSGVSSGEPRFWNEVWEWTDIIVEKESLCI